MGQKVTQTLEFEVWDLADRATLFACLADLVDVGKRGSVAANRATPEDEPVWYLEIGGDTATVATVGQKVVLFGGVLEAMTPEEYEARFVGEVTP